MADITHNEQAPEVDTRLSGFEEWHMQLAGLSDRLLHVNRVTEEDFVSVGASLEDLSHHFRRTLQGARKVLAESSGRDADNIMVKLGSIVNALEVSANGSDEGDISEVVNIIFTSLKQFVSGGGQALEEISRDTSNLEMLVQDLVVAVQFQDITRQTVETAVAEINNSSYFIEENLNGRMSIDEDRYMAVCREVAGTSFAEWERLVLVRHQLNDAKMSIRMSMEMASSLLDSVREKISALADLSIDSMTRVDSLKSLARAASAAAGPGRMKLMMEVDELQRLFRSAGQELRLLGNSVDDAQRVVTGRVSGPMGRIEKHWDVVDTELKSLSLELKKVHGAALKITGTSAVQPPPMPEMSEPVSQPGSVELF
jgi:hypothetical protein